MKTALLTILCLVLLVTTILGQSVCTNLGQNPYSAFPICGSQSFDQSTVALCGGRRIVTPCTDDAAYGDIIPYWYKFTCYKAGTLGFLITPKDLGDDYDWQLFDITGHLPSEVYTNASLFVACNWSQVPGLTGATADGSGLVNCAGLTYPPFSSMPDLILGHNYLLLVSHYTQTQSGYKLDFGGGSAVITDNTSASFQNAVPLCNGKITLKLNKHMKCSSLAVDGSDFTLNTNDIISGAAAVNCSTGFDFDSLTITFKNPLLPGQYTLAVKTGADGNTLLDPCDVPMTEGKSIDFTVLPVSPPVLDSIIFPNCPPDSIVITFDKPISCQTVDPDGSDFNITGPSIVKISGVTSVCDESGASKFTLKLSSPILVTGDYQLHIVKGSDGNTLIGSCGGDMAPTTKNFHLSPPVSAVFTSTYTITCDSAVYQFSHPGGNEINTWIWFVDGNAFGYSPQVIKSLMTGHNYSIKLFVSNSGCFDTAGFNLSLPKTKAQFNVADVACPEDSVSVANTSTGNIVSYLWNFDNGQISSLQDPPAQKYPVTRKEHYYKIALNVNSEGCTDTISKQILILSSCYIDVPNSFTPNGDGLNDYFYPLNAFKADNLVFVVYNRWGNKIFESHDWKNKWDGTYKGEPQPAGIYVWFLSYTDRTTKRNFKNRGSVLLIR